MKNIRKNNVERIKKLFEDRTGTPLTESNASFAGGTAVLRKPLPILAVIAVTAIMISVAAVAGGMLGREHSKVWGDDVELATDDNGVSGSGKLYTFDLSFSLDRDAPSEVVDFYVPHLSNEYRLDMGMIYDGL